MATAFTTSQPIQQWPALLRPESISLNLQFHTSSFDSPFTRTGQTQELPGALFNLSATFPSAQGDRVNLVRAWLAKLRGSAGRFYWPANGRNFTVPSAYAAEVVHFVQLDVSSVAITVDRTDITIDADQVAYETVFTCDGVSTDRTRITGTLWLNSNRRPLEIGGFVSFDDAQGWRHLHVIVDLQITPTTGAAVIVVEPPMQFLPTASTPIHVTNPSGVFRLKDDDQGSINLKGGRRYAELGSIEAVQAFPLRVIA